MSLILDCIEALLTCLDNSLSIAQCWNVLLCLSRRLIEWVACEATPIKKGASALAEDDSEVGVASYFLEYHRKKKEGLQDEEAELQDKEGAGLQDGEEGLQDDAGINGCGKHIRVSCISTDETTPPAVQCSIDIIRYARHHMTHGAPPTTRLCVLKCLQFSLQSLHNIQQSELNYCTIIM